jgi:hypothetical protein
MRIKVYIVTYKNPAHLEENLRTLTNQDFDIPGLASFEVFIINNHTEFRMAPIYEERVNVLHNKTRPDFSVGHLSRDWNAALVHGFVNLVDPQADLVILSQDDTVWKPNALKTIVEHSNQYSAIFLGNGDCVVAFRPIAIRRIGLWDERFSCNGFHEMDMFLRAAIYNGEETSINDVWHQLLPQVRDQYPLYPYLWNRLPMSPLDLIYRPDSNPDRREDKNKYSVYHHIPRELFKHKWGEYPELVPLAEQVERHKSGPITPQYIMYPYFEKDVFDLKEKNYLTCEPYSWI